MRGAVSSLTGCFPPLFDHRGATVTTLPRAHAILEPFGAGGAAQTLVLRGRAAVGLVVLGARLLALA